MFFCLNIEVIMLVFISLLNNASGLSWALVDIYLGVNSHHTAFTQAIAKVIP